MSKGGNGKLLEENNALMANGRTKTAQKESFSTWVYNKESGTFLGRNARSWGMLMKGAGIETITILQYKSSCSTLSSTAALLRSG
jgi:hypothetical protein